MKKFLIFLTGFISGAVFIVIICLAVANRNEDPMNISGLTMFEQPADVIDSSSFKVMQVGPGGNALAHSANERGYYSGVLVLLLADENTHYYDDQIKSDG
jgi:ABC-type transport system involved in multi-copper enzyme maturation permease subunit